jgi:hypothetical protein
VNEILRVARVTTREVSLQIPVGSDEELADLDFLSRQSLPTTPVHAWEATMVIADPVPNGADRYKGITYGETRAEAFEKVFREIDTLFQIDEIHLCDEDLRRPV